MGANYIHIANSPAEANVSADQQANTKVPGILLRMISPRNFERWAVVLGSLLAGAAYTWFAGEDINWDWRNYHEYGAFALLNGRFDQDVAPGGFQTFLNPLPYLPAYLLR